jgi:hypothetical protein
MTSLLAQIPYQVLVLLGSALVTVFKSRDGKDDGDD